MTFWDNDAGSKIHLLANPGQDVAPIGAARQEDSLLESQMQLGSLQYPHNPMKGASEHFHFLSVLAGTYDDTVRNIDIGRVGYLRHSFIAGFPTERVPKMPLSGVSTRSGDLARFTFKGLDGTMTDLFIHLVASPARAFPCLTKRSSPFLMNDTAFECAQKTRKKAGVPLFTIFWCLVAPLLSAPKKRRRGCPSSSFLMK